MSSSRINVRFWLVRVVTWDGVLPLIILGLPPAVHFFFPDAKKLIEALGVLLPIGAFLIRLFVGFSYIRANRCSEMVQNLQCIVLIIGIFGLVIFDAFMILQLNIPQGALQAGDWLVLCGILFAFYLPCMLLAMYPGREQVTATAQLGNWEVEA